MPSISSIVERLFKFTPLQLSEGTWGVESAEAVLGWAFLLFVFFLGLGAVYYLASIYRSNRSKGISLTLRSAALLLLCFPLFEPVLIVPEVTPRENFVAVVTDASRSMSITDGPLNAARKTTAQQVLYNSDNGILSALHENFRLRYYTFNRQAQRVDTVDTSRFTGNQTNLSAALERVLNDFEDVPLAGVVLLTDGNDNSPELPFPQAEQLRNLEIPLHIVGVGREAFAHDRELLDVTVNKRVEANTGAEINLKARSWQAETQPVTFSIYHNDELVFTENRSLSGKGTIDQFSFFFEPEEKEARAYTLEVSHSPDERNTQNNALRMLIDTAEDTTAVLYLEGHPRRDFKFIKRTFENDPSVKFTSITRTGTGRFYRQGIETPDELSGGFPQTFASLNRFKAVILGDIEASAFTPKQLQMLERFVRQRGGGVLMLGGQRSFGGGNYWNTPLADVLPVELSSTESSAPALQVSVHIGSDETKGFSFLPTARGLETPILKLSPIPSTNRMRWQQMPPLTSFNRVGPAKPGALVLAQKPADSNGPENPLLVTQRYGKGRSMVLATASTWRWQLQQDAQDLTYERFWGQLIRWLTASAPDRLTVDLTKQRFAPEEKVPITVQLYDQTYRPLQEASVQGVVIDPYGRQHEVAFQQQLASPGTYEASFPVTDPGIHTVSVEGFADDKSIGLQEHAFLVRAPRREFRNAALKKDFLQRLAQTGGGYYYNPSDAQRIPENLVTRKTSRSVYQTSYLWDMPFIFGLVILLLSAEWVYRRRQGLP